MAPSRGRGCEVAGCGVRPASKSGCLCGMRICAAHAVSSSAHACPRQAAILAMTPADVRAWKAAHAREANLRGKVVAGVNASGLAHVTAVDPAGGNLTEAGFPDITGRAPPDGRAVGIETKNSHAAGERQKGDCACASCRGQREWAAAFEADGGAYVGGVRDLQSALDGLRLALARARGGRP